MNIVKHLADKDKIMKADKKRVMTKPMSELQKNSLSHGRVLYYFNGLITRMQNPDHDVSMLMSQEQLATLSSVTQLLINMRNEVIRGLQVQRDNILAAEIRSGNRCPRCSAVGSKIRYVDQGAGLYALCKKCGNSWQVLDK